MTQILKKILVGAKNKEIATNTGTQMHMLLQHVIVDNDYEFGDKNIIINIKQHPEIRRFFVKATKTEVPIAGYVNGHFVSRRIDRLLINPDTKNIDFVDYKTDTDKTAFIKKYQNQLSEYSQLLQSAYPEYKINGYILWLHDWEIDKVI